MLPTETTAVFVSAVPSTPTGRPAPVKKVQDCMAPYVNRVAQPIARENVPLRELADVTLPREHSPANLLETPKLGKISRRLIKKNNENATPKFSRPHVSFVRKPRGTPLFGDKEMVKLQSYFNIPVANVELDDDINEKRPAPGAPLRLAKSKPAKFVTSPLNLN